MLRKIVAAQQRGDDVVLATRLTDGAQTLFVLEGQGAPQPLGDTIAGLDDDAVRAVARVAAPQTLEVNGDQVFLRPYLQPARLVVIGAVHIAQALVPMARIAGFRVTVLDPREGFATTERFPDVELVCEWPDRVFSDRPLGRRTALVTLTHDPRIDDPALIAALGSEAFYIGALGSRKTQASRRERLGNAGFASADLDRIHGPVGLPVGARTPEEIAVAVLAQVIGALRG